MILYSFLPIAPPGEENITEKLTKTQAGILPLVLIVSGIALLIFSLFSKPRRRTLYLLVSIILLISGIAMFFV